MRRFLSAQLHHTAALAGAESQVLARLDERGTSGRRIWIAAFLFNTLVRRDMVDLVGVKSHKHLDVQITQMDADTRFVGVGVLTEPYRNNDLVFPMMIP